MEKFPARFIERLEALLPAAEVSEFLKYCTAPLPKVVRLKNQKLLDKPSWTLAPTSVPEGYFIDRDDQSELPLGKTLEHFTGQIYSQSLSSMLPVVVLDPQADDVVLDLCAAPGSKTSFLAQRMSNTGVVIANEPSGSRAKKLAANIDRTASFNTVMIQSDGTILNSFIGQEFDRILLDAPCSSEGYGRRDSSFFAKMWSEPKILMAAKLQKRLIESSWEMLVPGGTMVYSTCTSAPEENECVVQHLIDTYPETVEILPTELKNVPHAKSLKSWEGQEFDQTIVEHAQRFYPHLSSETWNSESFFVCKLRKKTGVKRIPAKKPSQITQVKVFKKNQNAETVVKLAKKFGLDKDWPQLLMDGKPQFYIKQHDLYLTTPAATNFMQNNLFRRVGLRISDKDDNLTTEFAMQIGTHATQNVTEIDADQTARWLQGYDIPTTDETLSTLKNGTAVLVNHKTFGLGWGKVINGKIKNKLDRDLVF